MSADKSYEGAEAVIRAAHAWKPEVEYWGTVPVENVKARSSSGNQVVEETRGLVDLHVESYKATVYIHGFDSKKNVGYPFAQYSSRYQVFVFDEQLSRLYIRGVYSGGPYTVELSCER